MRKEQLVIVAKYRSKSCPIVNYKIDKMSNKLKHMQTELSRLKTEKAELLNKVENMKAVVHHLKRRIALLEKLNAVGLTEEEYYQSCRDNEDTMKMAI